MLSYGLFQLIAFFLIILALTKPLGAFMANVFEGRRTFLHPVLRPLESLVYKLGGVSESKEQRWTQYTASLLAFSVVSLLVTYLIVRLQAWLPWNPAHIGAMSPDLAFNTAVSFTTNTNWQAYTPEVDAQLLYADGGIDHAQFPLGRGGHGRGHGAGARICALFQPTTIGNFWVDLTRATVYVLLPISLVVALFLRSGRA